MRYNHKLIKRCSLCARLGSRSERSSPVVLGITVGGIGGGVSTSLLPGACILVSPQKSERQVFV